MRKFIMVLLLLITLVSSSYAQGKVCSLYGAIQATHFDGWKKACETASSETSCKAVYSSLEDLLNIAVDDSDAVLKEQVESCVVVVEHVDGWVQFKVQSLKGKYDSAKKQLNALMSKLGAYYNPTTYYLELEDK